MAHGTVATKSLSADRLVTSGSARDKPGAGGQKGAMKRTACVVAFLFLARVGSATPTTLPADLRAAYPLAVCVVSHEHLEAGNTVEYVHREAGKPDRLVRLCCRKCLARFKANAAKYLAELDAAGASKGKR